MKLITFSFDDGKLEDFTVAELLNKFNIPATFYVVAERLVQHDIMDRWYHTHNVDEIVQKYKNFNCEIGAHGYSHLDMSTCQSTRWNQETYDAKKVLDTYFEPVVSFAFPYGLTSPMFACYLFQTKLFESLRLYETPYDFRCCNKPEGLIKFLNVDMLTKSFLHIAGHSHELINLPERTTETFYKTAIDQGYKFVTVKEFYRVQGAINDKCTNVCSQSGRYNSVCTETISSSTRNHKNLNCGWPNGCPCKVRSVGRAANNSTNRRFLGR